MFSFNFCVSKVSKTVLDEVLITPGSQAIWIEGISLSLNSGILPISLILTSHSGWPCWPWYWLNIRVSVRYRNRPCLGRKWVIGHQILWNISPYKSLLENFGKNCTPCSNLCHLCEWNKTCDLWFFKSKYYLLYIII